MPVGLDSATLAHGMAVLVVVACHVGLVVVEIAGCWG